MNQQEEKIKQPARTTSADPNGDENSDIQGDLIEVWLAALRQALPELRACVVILDHAPDGFFWSQNIAESSPVPRESLFAAAGLARRASNLISTHDRHFLTVAIRIPDSRFSSSESPGKPNNATALGSIAVALDGPAELREPVVAELNRSATWFGNLYQKFFGSPIFADEDLPWLDTMLGGGSLNNRLVATANRFVELGAAERVAVGVVKRQVVRQVAISGQREFAKRSPLQHRLKKTMNETLSAWHDGGHPEPRITDHGLTLQIPLLNNGLINGVLFLDRRDGRKFTQTDNEDFLNKAIALGALIDLTQRAERDPVSRLARAGGRLKPANRGRGIAIAVAAALALAALMFPMPHLITADASIEGELQRALVAPMDTYLQDVHVLAGTTVAEGDLLATFATEDLSLELLKWQSERARKQKAKRDSAARQERSKLGVLEAEIAQANAEIALVESRIARRELHAPTDGIIVSGDLSQRLGSPVTRGEVLFEIVPNGDYQVMVLLDEQDVRNVQLGDIANLKLNAFPRETIQLEVARITPVNEVTSTGNYFVTYARLQDNDIAIRPGMRGIAKIDVGTRAAIVNWSESLRRWLRLKSWQWLG